MLLKGRRELDGIMLLAPEYIIAFKAKAWLDLSEKRENGMHVDDADIKKHKNDIARLATILEGTPIPYLPEAVRSDMERFISLYEEAPVDCKALRMKQVTNGQIIERLKNCYFPTIQS